MPFGSVGLPSIVVWAAVLGGAGILASFQRLDVRRAIVLFALWSFCACWLAVLLLQTWSSPATDFLDNPIWDDTARLLSTKLDPIPSALRFQPVLSQGPFLLAVLTLSCAFVLGAKERYARVIIAAFACSGLLYAIFGIVSYLIDPSKILGYDKDAYLAELTATFYNRNTAAIYFGCCAVIWLVFLSERIRRKKPSLTNLWDWRALLYSELLPPAVAILICLVAMFMTRSRAGSLASVVGLIVVLLGFFYRSLASRRTLLVAGVAAVAAAGVLMQFLGGGVTERVSVEGVSDQGRWQAYLSTWRIIQDYPWLGTGLGSFAWVFPAYRSPLISSWGVWDRAHNTFLELTSELGIPLGSLLALGWMAMIALLIRGILTRRRRVGCPAAALGVLVAATLHTMVDFPFQIPAFSIVVFAIVGAGLSQSFRPRRAMTRMVSDVPAVTDA
ncbi:O-antigen ligase family protein [Bradyrhizobium sp. BR 10289]|uniref:O-antigen ligase family protein n=1 Tax=Bradyrhizobium sp. BR 10289 TaxID=2749993 RepID=UPI001C646EFB|nr:O-antigen ligase family protein [Bradyrhizobium sp. BR 10289]MBW7971549.1 O-antigen ligase family protein [Bradyrhizobium sp. BR 10289]